MIVYEKLSEGGGGSIDHKSLTQFTPAQQGIIDKDPILGQLASDPQKTAELQKIITHDPQVFQAVDNPEAKSNLLKGLGYGQYASNGQEFVKLAALSADELGKLPVKIQIELEAWIDNQEGLKKQVVASLDQGITDGKKVVASKTAEINEQKESIDRSLPAIETLVGSAKDAMTSSGQSIIEGKLIEERDNPSSPINKKLIESGVSIQDISSAKYDDMRRASIMIGIVNDKDEFAKFKASGAIKDEMQFLGSINKIKELGVISSPVSLKNFSDHIDSRFPKTPETARAKEEISRSIESGTVSSIHYDGRGEKYTLIDRDGKTSKDVYMNPPRVTIRQSTLFHSFEIYTNSDILQRESEKKDFNSIKQSNNDRALTLLEMIQKGDGNEEKKKALLEQKEQDESSFNKFTISLGNLMKSNDRPTERADRAREMHIFLAGIRTTPVGLFDEEKSVLIDLENGLRKEASLAKLSKIPEGAKTISESERIVKSNLDLLVSEGFADMGRDATRALAKIIEFENRTNKRTNSNMISLERPIDKDTDLPRLKKYLEKLGITESSRRKAGLSDIQKSISISLSKLPDDPNSIESKLADKPKPEPS